MLRLLQDVCGVSSLCPSVYWISGVTRGRRIAAGGETTVYEGDYLGKAVAIRKFHCPAGGDWESPAGCSIVMVS